MDFARSQLLKYGWKDGQGLGKHETGMKDHVKVKLKMDKTGVGHDAGEEFTNHWWDHVFNKTAKSIQVTNSQDGVMIQKSSKHEKEISKSLQTYSKKAMTYGNFVRKATLTDGCEKAEKVVPSQDIPEPDTNTTPRSNYLLIPENEDEIFQKCGGRTAHKGARHGLKLNGKLQRIQEQEQLLLDKWKGQTTNQNDCNNSVDVDGKQTNVREDDPQCVGKRKKKKKKSKHGDKDVDFGKEKEHKEENSDSVRKKKKRKHNEDLVVEDSIVDVPEDKMINNNGGTIFDINGLTGSSHCEENEVQHKKKKKKNKKKKA